MAIYRGTNSEEDHPKFAHSWTLSEGIAWAFAGPVRSAFSFSYMKADGGRVYKDIIDIDYVLAYTDARNEKEVIIPLETVQEIEDIT